MNSRHLAKTVGASVAALAAAATVAQAPAALAQSNTAAPAAQPQAPAPGATTPVAAPDQAAARSYADQYARWAAQNCIDQRTGNTAAGAIVGGALGAIAGAALTGGHGPGALAGGAVGALTGAAVGSSEPTSCPPGYVVRAGAPVFVYGGPAYDPGLPPPWYQPWVWVGDRWVYYPYRYAYWFGPAYPHWRWVGRPWPVHHRL